MKFKNIITLIISFMLVNVGTVFAEQINKTPTLKEVYELKERCGKRAEEFFKREYGTGYDKSENTTLVSSYENHYNEKMNKCFMLVTAIIISKSEENSSAELLFDINENKQLGTAGKFNGKLVSCYVLNKTCDSFSEWKKLINKYMEMENED